ncbi:DNA-binding protein [Brachybacterium aquaticum]|uniref:Putative nucleic-acid-binding Zn-ribbon protein n=1 Tax=Brachybacterium aquaticum TaxID=1432564 RepID=A0A841ACV2_9MICO|nr:DNA-binding protein [Brachybacterium aquaticum]MBB5833099.1 putative nucleic-acid-binding Zn-ribbon protein [Brachybacterium aquaticum]
MAANEPVTAIAGERQVTCTHCGEVWFWSRRVVMSSSSASLFNLDGFSPTVIQLSCTRCGKVELFQPDALLTRGASA